jgi:hypothetical protein
MTKDEFLKSFLMFRSAPQGLIEGLLSVSRHQAIPVGKQIYAEGDACSAIAFVLS